MKRDEKLKLALQRKNTIGALITSLREASKETQDEMGRRLGYKSGQYVSAWERGSQAPSLKAWTKIRRKYGVTPRAIYDAVKLVIHHQTRQRLNKLWDDLNKVR